MPVVTAVKKQNRIIIASSRPTCTTLQDPAEEKWGKRRETGKERKSKRKEETKRPIIDV